MQRSERLGVRVRPVEKRLIEVAASDHGEDLSTFLRRVAVREASRTVLRRNRTEDHKRGGG